MTKQKHLVASGIATSYWEYGSPAHPTLVLLHGLKGSHGGLGPLIRELKDWHIIAPDLPNHGLSGDIDSPHGMTELTDWLIAFVQALGLDAPPHMAGHSFGGMLAMQALARQPELSSKLVLIVPVTHSSRF